MLHIRSSLIILSLESSMLNRYAGRHGAHRLQTRLDRILLECLGDASMPQKVDTRVRGGQTPSLIDLVLIKEDDMVQNVASGPPFGLSDHVVVAFDFMCYYGLEDVEKL